MLIVVFVHVFLDRITRIYFHSWRWVHAVLDLSWILTVSIHFGFLVYLLVYFGSNCCWDEIRFDRGFQTSTTDISLQIINPSISSYVIHLISLVPLEVLVWLGSIQEFWFYLLWHVLVRWLLWLFRFTAMAGFSWVWLPSLIWPRVQCPSWVRSVSWEICFVHQLDVYWRSLQKPTCGMLCHQV